MKTSKDFIVRRHFTDAQRRAIVAETQLPGMTVGAVARANKLSPPTVFNWIRRYKLGNTKNELVPTLGTMTNTNRTGCGQEVDLQSRIQVLEQENSQLKVQFFKLKAYVGGKLFEMDNIQ